MRRYNPPRDAAAMIAVPDGEWVSHAEAALALLAKDHRIAVLEGQVASLQAHAEAVADHWDYRGQL